jgi:hypothetical protein
MGNTMAEELIELPAYFDIPPKAACKPPVVTNAQELPFGELAWEDFERLCLRLARLEANVTHCQMYGTRGQKQKGIDLYAVDGTSLKYRVYQCKRENDFTARKIKKAVTTFLNGAWATKADTFVLCTKEQLIETKRADELEVQRKILADRGIALDPWDAAKLALKLKDLPRLVDDFFGRSWVQAYCGPDVAESLGERLDASEMTRFRQEFGTFYARVFEKHDPGLPVAENFTATLLPLRDRYVVPDVLEPRRGMPTIGVDASGETSIAEDGSAKAQHEIGGQPRQETVTDDRVAATEWLASGGNLLVLGGPGSGKSSLLRFVTLDLFDDSPTLASVARNWGSHLPIWVSFSRWTRLIENEGQDPCSLKRLLRLWLQSWDEERLWPVVEKALSDDRLLLLVDGLDEWSSEAAARIALDRLRVFTEQRNIPSIAVSRPQGFLKLGVRPAGWKIGRLAGFSIEQQQQLAVCWFRFLKVGTAAQQDSVTERRAHTEADGFMKELGLTTSLSTLAQTPLLLSLLIYHRMRNVNLPRTRFKAYESLVEHLIAVHPQWRRSAANDPGPQGELSGDDIKQALAVLAVRILKEGGEGNIEVSEAIREVERFLQDPERGLGLNQAESKRLGKQLVDVGESNLGLLVRQSPTTVGFLHRTFQEFLAADCIARLSVEEQLGTVEKQCRDPQWREVILALMFCNRRSHEVQTLVGGVRAAVSSASPQEKLVLESLLAEVAFGDFNCPATLIQDLAHETFQAIETGSRMSHRETLLGHALGGLAFTRVRELVKAKLRSWFPCWSNYRSDIYEAMGGWPAEPEVIECLWKAMHDQEPSNQRAAARALAKIGRNDPDVGNRIAKLTRFAEEPNTRAVALEALVRGWPTHDQVNELLASAQVSVDANVRMASIRGRLTLKTHSTTDRDELLKLGTNSSGVDYSWRRELPSMFLEGWQGDTVIKQACLDSLKARPHDRIGIDDCVAWSTLLAGFSQVTDIAEVIRTDLATPHPFLGVLDESTCWQLLAGNFRDNPVLGPSVDSFLANTPDPLAAAWAALIMRTDVGKTKLLVMLETGFPYWPAWALMEGWGMKDPDVAAKFSEFASRPPDRAGDYAYLFPRIISDANECRHRLLSLLRDKSCRRPDLVLEGLRTLGGPQPDTEVVDAVVRNNPSRPGVFWIDRDQSMITLIRGFKGDPRVRELARQQFSVDAPAYTAIAEAFPDDPELRRLLIDRLAPLPYRLRFVIAERLPHESADVAWSLELLGKYERDRDEEVKCQASLSYWELVKAAGPVDEQHVDRLSRAIVCYGPDHKELRHAAFCGLATIERLDIMANAKETIGEERICAVGTGGRMGTTNTPMLRCILRNWKSINDIFGNEACARLNHRHSDQMQLWEYLSPFVDGYPLPRRELLQFLESHAGKTAGAGILAFLGRTMPKSPLLMEYCLKALQIGNDAVDITGPVAVIASELLGANFRGNTEILARLLAGRAAENVYEKTVLCLCEGWEQTEALDRIYQFVVENKWGLRYATFHRLLCRKGDSGRISNEIRTLVNRVDIPPGVSGSMVVRPFVRRITSDGSLVDLLHHILHGAPTSSERASIPRLLAMGRGLEDRLRSWCIDELVNQRRNEGGFPELGFDVIAGRVRDVSQSLLDILEPSGAEEGGLFL